MGPAIGSERPDGNLQRSSHHDGVEVGKNNSFGEPGGALKPKSALLVIEFRFCHGCDRFECCNCQLKSRSIPNAKYLQAKIFFLSHRVAFWIQPCLGPWTRCGSTIDKSPLLPTSVKCPQLGLCGSRSMVCSLEHMFDGKPEKVHVRSGQRERSPMITWAPVSPYAAQAHWTSANGERDERLDAPNLLVTVEI